MRAPDKLVKALAEVELERVGPKGERARWFNVRIDGRYIGLVYPSLANSRKWDCSRRRVVHASGFSSRRLAVVALVSRSI